MTGGHHAGEVHAGRRFARSEQRSQALGDLKHDFRFALRQIARRPVFALVTIGILSLGVGANAAVFRNATDRQAEESGLPPSWPEYEALGHRHHMPREGD